MDEGVSLEPFGEEVLVSSVWGDGPTDHETVVLAALLIAGTGDRDQDGLSGVEDTASWIDLETLLVVRFDGPGNAVIAGVLDLDVVVGVLVEEALAEDQLRVGLRLWISKVDGLSHAERASYDLVQKVPLYEKMQSL